jgi:hypothetical protein
MSHSFCVAVVYVATCYVTAAVAAPATKPAATQPAATRPAATALEAARQYTDLFRAGHPGKAIDTYWDIDAMFPAMFGDDMKKTSAADRSEMRRLLVTFLHNVFANPQLVEAMSKADYTGFTAGEPKDGRTRVDFQVKLGPDKTIANALVFEHKEAGWRVVDASAGPKMLSEVVAGEYKTNKGISPLDFIKAMVSGG